MTWELWLLLAAGTWVVSVWGLYPLGMIVRAALKGRTVHPASGPLPSISVVIATRDDADAVAWKVRNCLASDYPPGCLEVIVAVDHRAPMPASLGDVPPEVVQLVRGDAPGGKAPTLNAGMRHARGDIVVCTDTWQQVVPTAFAHLVRAFEDESIGAVSGFLELAPGSEGSPLDTYWRLERELRRAEGELGSSIGVTGALYAIRRELWPVLPEGLILDDVYVPMSVVLRGRRVIVEPRAIALERRTATPGVEYTRKARTLAGNIQLVRWLPDVLHPRRNPYWLRFLFHKLLRLTTPFALALATVALLGLLVRHGVALLTHAWSLALLLVLAVALVGRSGREVVRWLVSLQLATVAGVYYGIRRRWDVWR